MTWQNYIRPNMLGISYTIAALAFLIPLAEGTIGQQALSWKNVRIGG